MDQTIQVPMLEYDDLPEGSDIQRRRRADEETIFIPAAVPPPRVRRRIAQEAMLASAGICALFVGLAGAGGAYFMEVWRLSTPLLLAATALFAIINLAAFIFVWRLRFAARLEAVAAARGRATMLVIRPGGVIIDIAAPARSDHHEISAGGIAATQIVHAPEENSWGVNDPVAILELQLVDGRVIPLAPGREEAELELIGRTLHRIFNAPLPAREGLLLRVLRTAGM